MKQLFKILLPLTLGITMCACGTKDTLDNGNLSPGSPIVPEIPDGGNDNTSGTVTTDYFIRVSSAKEDWSGEYLIAAEDRNGKEVVFGNWQKYGRPAADTDLKLLKDAQGHIPADAVRNLRTVIARNGDMYSVYVSNVGYLGVEKRHNLTYMEEIPEATRFHWTLSYTSEYGVSINNRENEDRQLLWNDAPDCFWFGTYTSVHDDIRPIILYELRDGSRIQEKSEQ